MARKTLTYTVTAEGRDKGKTFLITEMPASQGEEWATRALFTAMNCGVEVPDELLNAGLAGLSALGIKALSKVPYDLVKPLFDEMMGCVQVIPDRSNPAFVRPLIEDDVEEIGTRLMLRKATVTLHLDFFRAAAPSTQAPDAASTSPA
ncbi:hypothetical protein [Paraburkholderia saeva]|uniref:hypothetical protein n=1 Tax=Paraburkholderia saeva TaxID=2777537 RepID=UPI001D2602F7|nr:hypothetical protein [Paraburkholderia saeva]CAG4887991.1 hypothetical protein R52603_00552 [Paraburkholderia saeva]